MKEFGRRAIMRGAAALGVGAAASRVSSGMGAAMAHPPIGGYSQGMAKCGQPVAPMPTPPAVEALQKEKRERRFNESAEYLITEAMRSWSPIARHQYMERWRHTQYTWHQMMEDKINEAWKAARDPVGSLLRETSSQPSPTRQPLD